MGCISIPQTPDVPHHNFMPSHAVSFCPIYTILPSICFLKSPPSLCLLVPAVIFQPILFWSWALFPFSQLHQCGNCLVGHSHFLPVRFWHGIQLDFQFSDITRFSWFKLASIFPFHHTVAYSFQFIIQQSIASNGVFSKYCCWCREKKHWIWYLSSSYFNI